MACNHGTQDARWAHGPTGLSTPLIPLRILRSVSFRPLDMPVSVCMREGVRCEVPWNFMELRLILAHHLQQPSHRIADGGDARRPDESLRRDGEVLDLRKLRRITRGSVRALLYLERDCAGGALYLIGFYQLSCFGKEAAALDVEIQQYISFCCPQL